MNRHFLNNRWPWMVLVILVLALLATGCAKDVQQQQRSALHHFKIGNQAFAAEDYLRAIHHFETAVELDSQSPDLFYNLGLAHYVTGNYNAAVLSLQDALELNPTMADAHYNLALAYDKLYNASSAHAHYNTYRNMLAGTNMESGAKRANPLPPPPNASGGKRSLVNQAQRNLAAGTPGGKIPRGMQQATTGSKTAGQVIPPGAKRLPPAYRSANKRNVTGMPQGVRQKLPMANPNNGRQPIRPGRPGAPTNATQTTKDKPFLGGSEKWWIQDRFDQKW